MHLQHDSLPFLSQASRLKNILTQECAEIKISREFLDENVTYVFRLFDFWNIFSPFFFLLYFSFCCTVIELLLGLLAVKKHPRERHRDGHSVLPWSSQA